MWEAILAIIPLALLLFKEFFSEQARAREANEKFTLDEATRRKIATAAVNQWIQSNAKDSQGAGDAWDQADKNNQNPRS